MSYQVRRRSISPSFARASKDKGMVRTRKDPSPKFSLSDRQKKDLMDAFNLFDDIGAGRIDSIHLKIAFRALGYEASRDDIDELVKDYFLKHSFSPARDRDCLSLSDFIAIMERKMTQPDTKEDIVKSFRLIDQYEKGAVNFECLREVADILEEDITDQELIEMIEFTVIVMPEADEMRTSIQDFLLAMGRMAK